MLGQEGVAQAVTVRFREKIPAKIAELVERYPGVPSSLNGIDPSNIHPTAVNVISIGNYPAMLVTIRDNVSRTGNSKHVDKGGGFDEYEYRYRVLVHAYVTGDDYAPTELARYRMVLALREVLLTDRMIITGPGDQARIDDLTIREEFEPGLNSVDNKLLGYAIVEFEVVTSERLTIPGQGSVDVAVHPIDLEG